MKSDTFTTHSPEKKIMNCICNNNSVPNESIIQCMLCYEFQHINCVGQLPHMSKYLCPNCQFKHSDIFTKNLHPLILKSKIVTSKTNDTKASFSFFITNEQLQTFSKDNKSNNHFISIQCLLLNKDGFTLEWPLNSTLSINKKKVLNIPKKKYFSQYEKKSIILSWNEDHKEVAFDYNYYPYDQNIIQVKEYLFDNINNILEIEINKRDNEELIYCITADVIEVFNFDEAIKEIRVVNDKKLMSEHYKLLNSIDIQTQMTKEKMTLIDLYTKNKRISFAGRGLLCKHLKVFDIKSFINANRKNRTYNCPICNMNSNIVYIDGFIQDIINNNLTVNTIVFDLDYNFELLKDNCEEKQKDSNEINKNKGKEVQRKYDLFYDCDIINCQSGSSNRSLDIGHKMTDSIENIQFKTIEKERKTKRNKGSTSFTNEKNKAKKTFLTNDINQMDIIDLCSIEDSNIVDLGKEENNHKREFISKDQINKDKYYDKKIKIIF